jgi:hypothetical protein
VAVGEVIDEAGTRLGSLPGGRLSITRVGPGFRAGTRIVNGTESRSSTGSESLAVAGAESLAVADTVSVAEAGAVPGAKAVVQKLEKSFSYEAEKGGGGGGDPTGTKIRKLRVTVASRVKRGMERTVSSSQTFRLLNASDASSSRVSMFLRR